jgi:hypothetical protein
MHKLIVAAVIACSFSAPAMAACHGHSNADGKWTLNFDSWSDSEKTEMVALAGALKQNKFFTGLPPGFFDLRELANATDQLECQGISHEKAIQIVIQATITAVEARKE